MRDWSGEKRGKQCGIMGISLVWEIELMDFEPIWKILKEMGVSNNLIVSWETCMQVKKQQLEPDKEQWTS